MNVWFVLLCMVVIAILAWRTAVLVRGINQRLAELDEERARNPLDPFSALMELYRLQEHSQSKSRHEND
ncbi:MAG: hypothetical protein SNJ72_02480 [Fimbriimonadales bacterium]